MIEERALTSEDVDLLATEGRDDGFNLAPIETARLLMLGKDTSMEATAYWSGGELIAISGLYAGSLISDEVHIWMVSALAIKRHRIAFLRHAPKVLRRLRRFGRATCFCDPGFGATCRWLGRLGFTQCGETLISGRRFLVLERAL